MRRPRPIDLCRCYLHVHSHPASHPLRLTVIALPPPSTSASIALSITISQPSRLTSPVPECVSSIHCGSLPLSVSTMISVIMISDAAATATVAVGGVTVGSVGYVVGARPGDPTRPPSTFGSKLTPGCYRLSPTHWVCAVHGEPCCRSRISRPLHGDE